MVKLVVSHSWFLELWFEIYSQLYPLPPHHQWFGCIHPTDLSETVSLKTERGRSDGRCARQHFELCMRLAEGKDREKVGNVQSHVTLTWE